MCTMTHYHTETLHFKTEKGRGGISHGELKENALSISIEGPMVIPLSLSSVMYTQCILVFILFRFDDGAKLKKRNSGDVSYLKKSVSYLQDTLNQMNMNQEKVVTSALFPLESYFPIFFSLEMTLYSDGDML